MADVSTEFQRYMHDNPEAAQQLGKIISTLYSNPMKQSQVQPFLKQMFGIQEVDPSKTDALRKENM